MIWVLVISLVIFIAVNYYDNTRIRICPYCENELTPIDGNYYCPSCDIEFSDYGLCRSWENKRKKDLKKQAREKFYSKRLDK